jgi:glycine/D-amino acid oxidase-like deaminating enzyme
MSHVPFWFGLVPKSGRPAYRRLRGEQTTRVVIVGGGLTGAACALTCAAAGIDPILLEAEIIGGATTAGSTGLLREGCAGSFDDAAKAHGLRTARHLWDTMRRGSLDFAAALRRYKIRCGLEPQHVLSFARPGEEAGRLLRREYDARRRAGVEGTWVMSAAVARETAIVSAGAIRTRGAVVDPYRACIGLAAAAEARGARLHEKSEVKRIRASKKYVDVQTAAGTVRADIVVVATGAPIQDLRALRRHLHQDHVYGILTAPLPAAAKREVGKRAGVLEDAAGDGRIIRWMEGDRIFVHGRRQPAVPDRARERAITQRTGQMMYELSLLYPAISGLPAAHSWDGVDYETADGLPLLGPHRNFPRHLFALGSARHGAGLAWTAARLLLRQIHGGSLKSDDAFGFHR